MFDLQGPQIKQCPYRWWWALQGGGFWIVSELAVFDGHKIEACGGTW